MHKLFDEIIRRRLWPLALVAAVVAVAAPLFFLKSTPPDAPAGVATAAPVPATGQLPARARRLLAAPDAAKTPSRRPAGSASDPFQPPTSTRSGAAKATSSKGDSAAADPGFTPAGDAVSQDPVPVVIQDGTAPATPSIPATDQGTTTTTTTTTPSSVSVDVRFGEQYPGEASSAIPRLQPFVAGGRVVAIFVKYSPARETAVFAIAPSTAVEGDVECRQEAGVCRYVDIPAGAHVRLTTTAAGGTSVTRRLDVVRITPAGRSAATAEAAPPANGSCLLGKLLALTTDDPPLASDAC
jgi:hypothetical protein